MFRCSGTCFPISDNCCSDLLMGAEATNTDSNNSANAFAQLRGKTTCGGLKRHQRHQRHQQHPARSVLNYVARKRGVCVCVRVHDKVLYMSSRGTWNSHRQRFLSYSIVALLRNLPVQRASQVNTDIRLAQPNMASHEMCLGNNLGRQPSGEACSIFWQFALMSKMWRVEVPGPRLSALDELWCLHSFGVLWRMPNQCPT